MPNRIVIDKQASKFLERLRDAKLRQRLEREIRQLAENAHPAGSCKIEGCQGVYRVRVGDYRIVYQVTTHPVVVVTIIEHRSKIYQLVQRSLKQFLSLFF